MSYRREFKRAQLLAAGRKARAAILAGVHPNDVLFTFPGSRATLYRTLRALDAADRSGSPADALPGAEPSPAADTSNPAQPLANRRKFKDPLLL